MSRYVFLTTLIEIMVFMLGAGIGSFLNVVIYRVPLGISVNNPSRSFCPSCKQQIPWYLNIPLLSWLMLRGRCAKCGAAIPPRYFFVELLTAIIFYGIYRVHGGPWEQMSSVWGLRVLAYWIFAALLIAGTFIDIDYYILPRFVTIGGLVVGLIASTVRPGLMGETLVWRGFVMSLVSAALGAGVLWTIVELGKLAFGRIKKTFATPEHWSITQSSEEEPPILKVADLEVTWDDIFVRASDKLLVNCSALQINDSQYAASRLEVRSNRLMLRKEDGALETIELETVKKLEGQCTEVVIPREAMGYGDVLLLAMIGSFLGWKAVLFTIVASSFLGSVVGGVPRLLGRVQWTTKLPFGPYLAAGALIWVFVGPDILLWYMSHMRPHYED